MSGDVRDSEAPTVQEENEQTEVDEMDAMKPDRGGRDPLQEERAEEGFDDAE